MKNNSFRRTGFPYLGIIVVSIVLLGFFMQSCSKEDVFNEVEVTGLFMDVIENTDNFSLEVRDFKNWFESQKIVQEFIGKHEPNWSNAELKLLPDGNSLEVAIEIYKGKNSLGNDSIRELQIANVKNSFIGGVKAFSFYNEKNAHVKYYSLSGQLLEEGEYYAPKQQYILLKRYAIEKSQVRLKSGSESGDPCNGTQLYNNSATPLIINGAYNSNAYNCHTYVWGALSANDPCYMPYLPLWNNCPNISASGYSRVTSPQVGDRWVSYGNISGWGYTAVHSAIVKEVINGHVTKVEAKCGEDGIYIYNPDCSSFGSYMTNDIRYYR
jgi:hypothetical protein